MTRERPRIRLADGYTVVVDGKERQPYTTKREAYKQAREVAQDIADVRASQTELINVERKRTDWLKREPEER